jgi:hypothetical protein
MSDKKLILEYSTHGDVRPIRFYDDGTYIRNSGETSWWKYDGKYIYIRHGLSSKWLVLDEISSWSDREVANRLIDAIQTRIVEEALLGEEEGI